MALINSGEYSALGDYSGMGSSNRGPSKFKNLYITGAKRAGEEIGKLQLVKRLDDGTNEFISKNKDSIKVIIMYLKKMRAMYKKVKEQDQLICFSYSGEEGSVSSSGRKCPASRERENGWCNDCRMQCVAAGMVLDTKGAPLKIDDKETGEESNVYFYTRNAGTKFGSIIKFEKSLTDKAKDLPMISDNEDFEKTSVLPRRFVVEITVDYESTAHGDKAVYKYTPISKLKDETVLKILDECNKTIKEFDSQFDSSKYMKSSAGTGTTDREGGVKFDDEAGSEKEDVVNEGKKTSGEKSGDEETVDDIDLGF